MAINEQMYLNQGQGPKQKGIRTGQFLGARSIADTGVVVLNAIPILGGETLSSMRLNAYAITEDLVAVKHAQWINWGVFFTPFAFGTSNLDLSDSSLSNNAYEYYLKDKTLSGAGTFVGWSEPDDAEADHLMEYATNIHMGQKESLFFRQQWMMPLSDGSNVSLVDRFQTVIGRGKKSYFFPTSGYLTLCVFLYDNDADETHAILRMDDSMSTSAFLLATNQASLGSIMDNDETWGTVPKEVHTLLYGGDTFVQNATLRADDNDTLFCYAVSSVVIKTPYPRPIGEW